MEKEMRRGRESGKGAKSLNFGSGMQAGNPKSLATNNTFTSASRLIVRVFVVATRVYFTYSLLCVRVSCCLRSGHVIVTQPLIGQLASYARPS